MYSGHFKKGKAHGYGVLITNGNGASYKGEWAHDKKHGIGSEEWQDGSMYTGDYVDGNKQGIGSYDW